MHHISILHLSVAAVFTSIPQLLSLLDCQPTMVQNNQEFRRKYWATRSSFRSFAQITHSFACSALLDLLAPSAAHIRLFARSLAHSQAPTVGSDYHPIPQFCPNSAEMITHLLTPKLPLLDSITTPSPTSIPHCWIQLPPHPPLLDPITTPSPSSALIQLK